MKRKILFSILLLAATTVAAEVVNPVQWSVEQTAQENGQLQVVFKAVIADGWHLYDTNIGEGGPVPTTFSFSGVQPLSVSTSKQPQTIYDNVFEMTLAYYTDNVDFVFLLPDASAQTVSVRFMSCNDTQCTAPEVFEYEIQPVVQEAADSGNSLWMIFWFGLLGGLLAIFTPCVWPIIPMTVSFFIKRSSSKNATKDALLYGLAIIIIYETLGLLVTVLFGASALNEISTNAVVNIFFFLLLVVFAISFFGAFELTLPSSWSTALSNKAHSSSGFLSILLMAFTLVIVSFSCTGPIIGTLLVEAAGKSLLAPAVGMLGFAVALALPFSLFAMFPKWMKQLPKSGQWMNSFKVVLAFLELALSLKFFSVADLAYGWHLLDREVFVALWVVIFMLLGFYLLGFFHFKHEDKPQGISVLRLMLAIISLSFSIYLLPGLWGAPLKAVSAFAPPMNTQDFVIQTQATQPHLDDLDAALEKAKQENKLVLLDFSGYGCVNCRKMEAKVLTDERVAKAMQDYVLLTLMVDDRTELNEPIQVEENGKKVVLKTVGQRWSYLQRTRFDANAQPFYVKLNTDGKQVGTPIGYTPEVEAFLNWLE